MQITSWHSMVGMKIVGTLWRNGTLCVFSEISHTVPSAISPQAAFYGGIYKTQGSSRVAWQPFGAAMRRHGHASLWPCRPTCVAMR